ncbi:MAG: zf-HC2 domain-containing protein [Acidobacteria bacterium]|nr:zf-HC2 domain-containing protein [Acidobacteriota bacterium]
MSAFFIGHPKEIHLALFAGGELGPVARWRIERHLQNCESCQTAVSDFFHLQGDLTELSKLPSSVDWDGMALRIREAVAQADQVRTEPTPGFFSNPLVLRFGLATATALCGFIVIQQRPLGETPQSAITAQNQPIKALGGARLAEQAKAPEFNDGLSSSQAPVGLADRDLKATNEAISKREENFAAPQENAQFGNVQNKQKDLVVATGQSLPGDEARAFAPPAPEKKSDSESFRVASDLRANAGNRRGAGRETNLEAKEVSIANAPARAIAPAAPAAPAIQGAALGEADAAPLALLDQVRRRADGPALEMERAVADKTAVSADEITLAEARSETAVVGQTSRQKIQAGQEGGALGMPAALTPTSGALTSVALTSIAPPSRAGQDVDVDVNMDGGLRYRTVDAATGRITITDVYAP